MYCNFGFSKMELELKIVHLYLYFRVQRNQIFKNQDQHVWHGRTHGRARELREKPIGTGVPTGTGSPCHFAARTPVQDRSGPGSHRSGPVQDRSQTGPVLGPPPPSYSVLGPGRSGPVRSGPGPISALPPMFYKTRTRHN